MTSIEEDNIKQLQRFQEFPPSASYIAGVIDGDGCVFIRKYSSKGSHPIWILAVKDVF